MPFTPPSRPPLRRPPPHVLALAAVLLALLWAQGPTLATVARRWATDPQYSHGYLVVVFAVYLAWTRREHFHTTAPESSYSQTTTRIGGSTLTFAAWPDRTRSCFGRRSPA